MIKMAPVPPAQQQATELISIVPKALLLQNLFNRFFFRPARPLSEDQPEGLKAEKCDNYRQGGSARAFLGGPAVAQLSPAQWVLMQPPFWSALDIT